MGDQLIDAGGVLIGARRRWTNCIGIELVEYARDTLGRGIPRCVELLAWLHRYTATRDAEERCALCSTATPTS